MWLARHRCYCNAIQSHVTIRLVVWLHNPICQAIGHRRAGAAVRVIPCGGCSPLPRAPRRCGEGREPGSRNSPIFRVVAPPLIPRTTRRYIRARLRDLQSGEQVARRSACARWCRNRGVRYISVRIPRRRMIFYLGKSTDKGAQR